MSIEGETEYKAKVRLEARLGEHLNFSPGGLAQNCQHVAGFEPGSCGSETRILSLRHTPPCLKRGRCDLELWRLKR